jgi:hypothetical protein
VQIPKDQVLRLLRSRGDDRKVDEAERELPDSVDTDQHADLLARLGVDRKDLMSKLGGGGDLRDSPA